MLSLRNPFCLLPFCYPLGAHISYPRFRRAGNTTSRDSGARRSDVECGANQRASTISSNTRTAAGTPSSAKRSSPTFTAPRAAVSAASPASSSDWFHSKTSHTTVHPGSLAAGARMVPRGKRSEASSSMCSSSAISRRAASMPRSPASSFPPGSIKALVAFFRTLKMYPSRLRMMTAAMRIVLPSSSNPG